MLALAPIDSWSVRPAALMLTEKIEPEAKLAFPPVLKVVKAVTAPGATVPPDATERLPTRPFPASVAPFSTVTAELAIAPSTSSRPAAIVVAPE
jgi:hypothetical protein